MKKFLSYVKNPKGQSTVEFVMMLAAIVAAVLAFVALFHTQIIGGFFTIIGSVLG
ncbi:MAG: hypothetical protein HN833_03110 [Elusimicrobiaceae bacterium]|jgi:hypothetical protein|nr:hypothetical protein [Elusimicrobiaceae bacterium]MBT3954646.1 hypothetical protein [Elusimicrobiaceae bacterium]MBT4007954.1 hypothetical protein [Elusimicrobiaceae bacterium]MBT4403295.1 hypothetical protein [Elusimicrobiaceae bacterium]MBT4439968.1 hypothetical protein [Elusimicrobiaceae bacterium]